MGPQFSMVGLGGGFIRWGPAQWPRAVVTASLNLENWEKNIVASERCLYSTVEGGWGQKLRDYSVPIGAKRPKRKQNLFRI